MKIATANCPGCREPAGAQLRSPGRLVLLLVVLCILPIGACATQGTVHQALIPVLGVTMESNPTGQVVYLVLSFEKRRDEGGLAVLFRSTPSGFSRMTQTAVEEAIYRTAQALDVSPRSWTVMLSLPYPGITVYGDSCTAMIALSVLALAKGDVIPFDRVITGTITPDGHIGPVGEVSLKVAAAKEAHLRWVLVPAQEVDADRDEDLPFAMQIAPVGTILQAYQVITDYQSIP
jgi:predicted S18 family serine protease